MKKENFSKEEIEEHNVLLVIFYIGKLTEGQFTNGVGIPKVTGDGFELCMKLIESGWVVDKNTVLSVCDTFLLEPIEGFAFLILEVQEIGLPNMLQKAKANGFL